MSESNQPSKRSDSSARVALICKYSHHLTQETIPNSLQWLTQYANVHMVVNRNFLVSYSFREEQVPSSIRASPVIIQCWLICCRSRGHLTLICYLQVRNPIQYIWDPVGHRVATWLMRLLYFLIRNKRKRLYSSGSTDM